MEKKDTKKTEEKKVAKSSTNKTAAAKKPTAAKKTTTAKTATATKKTTTAKTVPITKTKVSSDGRPIIVKEPYIKLVVEKPQEETKKETKEEVVAPVVEENKKETEGPAIIDLGEEKTEEKSSDEILSEEPEGVYTKKESDIEKNFVYKNPTGTVDNVNVLLSDAIDGARVKFVKSYKSNRLGSSISLGIFSAFLIATAIVYITLSKSENKALYNGLIWPFLSLAIVALICFLFFSNMSKKKSTQEIQQYLDTWTDSFVSAAYCNKEGIENISYSVEGKVDDWSVINTHYFSTIDSIDSRNHIVLEYLGKTYCDTEVSITVPLYSDFVNRIASEKVIEDSNKKAADEPAIIDVKEEPKKGNKTVEKRQRSPYVGGYGKFISYSLCAKGDNDYLIITRETKETYLPTNVHGLTRYDNLAAKHFGEGYVIWASDSDFVESVLSKDVVTELLGLEPNAALEDWFFTFNKKGASFMLNYGKPIMELPMYEKVHADEVNQYPNDVSHILTIFKILSNKF